MAAHGAPPAAPPTACRPCQRQLGRQRWRGPLETLLEATRNFTPSWFSASMSTGIISLLIVGFPYSLPAQRPIGWAFWWANCALFLLFTLMFLGRLILFRDTIKPMLMHPVQSMFIGCIPMALSTIVNGFPRTAFLAYYWDAQAVNDAAVIVWSISAVIAALSNMAFPLYMFMRHKHSWERLTAVWLLPIVPGVVASASGGLIAISCDPVPARRIILASTYLWGLSVPLSLMVITLYLGRLTMYNLPPKELIVSSFLPVGPLAMSALALLNLGTASRRPALQAGDPTGFLLAFAPGFEHAGTAAAVMLWGASTWWLVVAVASVLSTVRSLPFNMGWWGFVFPCGVLSLTTVALSKPEKLDSGAFKVVGAAFSAATLALYCMVVAFTFLHWWRGNRLFVAPCLSQLQQAGQAGAAVAPGVGPGAGAENGTSKEKLGQRAEGGGSRSGANGSSSSEGGSFAREREELGGSLAPDLGLAPDASFEAAEAGAACGGGAGGGVQHHRHSHAV